MKKLLLLLLLSDLTLAAGHGQAISPYLTGQNAWLPTALGTQVFNGQLDRSNGNRSARAGMDGHPARYKRPGCPSKTLRFAAR